MLLPSDYDQAEHRAKVATERAEAAETALDGLRQHHSKIIMALYEIDHDVFGPLTSIEGIAELKHQRDDLRRQLEQARRALKPFTHPDLAREMSGNKKGDASIIFQRNEAIITIGDIRMAIEAQA